MRISDWSSDVCSSDLWSAAGATLRGIGQTVIVCALTYFLLVSGHSFKRKLVRISGESLHEKKVTVQILEEIDAQIQRYLLIQLGTSALVGVGTGLLFAIIRSEEHTSELQSLMRSSYA